jgi:hypothetical protein
MKTDSVKFSILKWGSLFGIVSIINAFLNEDSVEAIKPGFKQLAQLAFYFFSIGFCIWLVHRDYKYNNNNNLSFGRGISLALLVGSFVGMLICVFCYIRYSYFYAEYMEKTKQNMMLQFEERGLGSSEIDPIMNQFDFFFSPLAYGISNFIGTIFFFLVIGLIVSGITQKEKSIFED